MSLHDRPAADPGGHGHPRLWEFVLGGATDYLLAEPSTLVFH